MFSFFGSSSSSSSQKKSNQNSSNIADSPVISRARSKTNNVSEPVSESALRAALACLPPKPFLKEGAGVLKVKSITGESIEVSESLSLYITSWSMNNCHIPDTEQDLQLWIPKEFNLYCIGVQDCKKVDALDDAIFRFIGGPEAYHRFKSKEISGTSMLMYVSLNLYQTGVFKMAHVNGLAKHEIKVGKLVGGGSSGRGAIAMKFSFHNTVLAFITCKLDAKSQEKRFTDLEFILQEAGLNHPEVQEIGTPHFPTIHHAFLLGDFGVKINYPPKSSLKSLTPHRDMSFPWEYARWETLLKFDELNQFGSKISIMKSFSEIPISYPPTAFRKKDDRIITNPGDTASVAGDLTEKQQKQALTLAKVQRVLPLFEDSFVLDDLFDIGKGSSLPGYPDRILFRSLKDHHHLIEPGTCGSSEGLVYSPHIPVFATFSINGVDPTLLKKWQIITGNMPPEFASRSDKYIVGGIVSEVQDLVQAQEVSQQLTNTELEKAEVDEAAEDQSLPLCEICTRRIKPDANFLELGEGKKFHADCFNCSQCAKSLVNEKFFHVDGHWLCENDYKKLYVKNCPRCKLAINGPFLRVGTNQFHQECFSCTKPGCGKSLINEISKEIENFEELDGKPFCIEHYKEITSTMTFCAACNKRIREGETGIPHNRQNAKGIEERIHFHANCFHCNICHEDLHSSKKKFIIAEGLMYCEHDFKGLYGEVPKPPR